MTASPPDRGPYDIRAETLAVEQHSDHLWRLTQDFHYVGKTQRFTIGAGFLTDFASVPQPLWWLVPRSGRYTKAAVVHDALVIEARRGHMSRCDADGIFRRILRELQVPFLRRWLLWGGVRLGGRFFLDAGCGVRAYAQAALVSVFTIALGLFAFVVLGLLLAVFWLLEWAMYWLWRALGVDATRPSRILIWMISRPPRDDGTCAVEIRDRDAPAGGTTPA